MNKLDFFIVQNIDGFTYTLKNENSGEIQKINITFLKFDKKVKKGDFIFMHSQLFDQSYYEYSPHYYFGPINESYGREIKSPEDIDYMAVKIDNQKYDLKRFYG